MEKARNGKGGKKGEREKERESEAGCRVTRLLMQSTYVTLRLVAVAVVRVS